MQKSLHLALISALLLGVFGCAAEENSAKAAANARVDAAEARAAAADANARSSAADAHVRAADARVAAAEAGVEAADADARVKTTTTPANAVVLASKDRLVIPSGTEFTVTLIDPLGTDTNVAGDRFLASLAENVVVNGTTILQKGTKVRGRVLEVDDAGRVKGLASIRLALTDILQGDRMIPITTDTFGATAESSKTRDGEVIAGGAGVGAIIGAIAGGKKGAAIGAVTGGSAGTGVILATKGEQIHYGAETHLNFTLAESVQM